MSSVVHDVEGEQKRSFSSNFDQPFLFSVEVEVWLRPNEVIVEIHEMVDFGLKTVSPMLYG